MFEKDGLAAQALGGGRAHVVLTQRFDELTAQDARVGRGADDCEREGRQNCVIDVVPEVDAVAAEREPAVLKAVR